MSGDVTGLGFMDTVWGWVKSDDSHDKCTSLYARHCLAKDSAIDSNDRDQPN